MAKDKKIKESETPKSEILAVYFKSLMLENVKCFKDKNTIDLSDSGDKPAMWTVILGNNNTGKTTILKCLAGLEGVQEVEMIDNLENDSNPISRLNKNKSKENFTFPIAYKSLKNEFNWFFSIEKIRKAISCEFYFHKKIRTGFLSRKEFFEKDPRNLTMSSVNINENLSANPVGPIDDRQLDKFKIYPYSTTRKISDNGVGKSEGKHDVQLRFFKGTDLPNIEEWLLQLFLSEKLGQTKARHIINQVKEVLTSGLLPDVNGLEIKSIEVGNSFENFIEFDTDYGKVRLKDLGYGYQSMMGWVLDLVRRMVERYPSVEKPLEQPAIVLVDEIDLHLHPEWQRKIIAHLTKYFPK